MIYFFKGLFIGFSVFSPIEVFYIIFNFLMVYFRKEEECENDKKNENGENDGTNSLNNNIALF